MKNALTVVFLFFYGILCAQTDSSRLDPGWVTLDRGLTQTIRVKGADLEKMPFVNLDEAIRVWFYGAYTVPGTLAYVVDGNPVTDVNLYSIYDIEEVELVQNAVGAAAYGSSQQDVVVIRTKRGTAKSGFRAAAQAGPVNQNGSGIKTFTNVYHQYYLGGYANTENLSAGLSAGWVRDVLPALASSSAHILTPINLQRLRLNGYVCWQPVKGQIVEFGMGYAPERIDADVDSMQGANEFHLTERMRGHVLAPQLSWKGELTPGLKQEFRAGYTGGATDFSEQAEETLSFRPGVDNYPGVVSKKRVNQLFVDERLSYLLQRGDWIFRPAANLFYDQIDEKTASGISRYDLSNGTVIYPAVLPPLQEQKGDLLLLTPSVELGYRHVVNLQAGVQADLHAGSNPDYGRLLPFATLGVDLLGFGKERGKMSLVLSGSYAERTQAFVDDYSLMNLSGGGGTNSLTDVYRERFTPVLVSTGGGGRVDTLVDQLVPTQYPKRWSIYQGGVSFATGKIFRISYHYEHRNFLVPGSVIGYLGNTASQSVAYLPEYKSDGHHIDIRLKISGDKDLSWETGLGVTALRSKENFPNPTVLIGNSLFVQNYSGGVGDLSPAKLSWTGGFVNRLKAGGFEAGLDIIYHFGKTLLDYNPYGAVVFGHLNSVTVPNVYLGYNWKLPHAQSLGLFVESRGLARSKSSDLPDDRRYYTIGGSWSL